MNLVRINQSNGLPVVLSAPVNHSINYLMTVEDLSLFLDRALISEFINNRYTIFSSPLPDSSRHGLNNHNTWNGSSLRGDIFIVRYEKTVDQEIFLVSMTKNETSNIQDIIFSNKNLQAHNFN